LILGSHAMHDSFAVVRREAAGAMPSGFTRWDLKTRSCLKTFGKVAEHRRIDRDNVLFRGS
jgi:hypothetical protein